ncbi:hypothetical protein SVA_0252 [Sulfurifustis variabilis]|uniref:Uncharacterized protein n=1 Tax=Sulfurifustis variabilis TaxID=1675686 RepID=A0A1B4V6H6_9GAMM|nr:hypothetical protein [Sulfurifustis variabilis]BAU46834.1 hypothetical protein SVA_0252 [Sulfurifustis variabilis]
MGKATPPLSRFAGQAAAYVLFAAFIGVFSDTPAYHPIGPDEAAIKLSFSHAGERAQPCRTRSPEEVAQLPPNMRLALDCPRERSPVRVELRLDDRLVYEDALRPAGLKRDMASTVYRRFTVPAGEHALALRLSDRPDGEFNYAREARVTLRPAQLLVIDFKPESGGFVLQ